LTGTLASKPATAGGRLRPLIGAALFAAALALYLGNLTQLAPCFFASNSGPFLGADSFEIAAAMRELTFAGDMEKHLLFSAVTWPLVTGVAAALSVDQNTAIIYVLALMAAAAVTSAWWVLARYVTTTLVALLFALVYGLAFVNLVLFSIPETYAASGLAITAYLGLVLARGSRTGAGEAVLHGFAAGLAGLFNPPLLSLLVVSALHRVERRALGKAAAFAAIALAAAAVTFAIPYALLRGPAILDFVAGYTRQWASFAHLVDPGKIAFVLVSFFVVSFLSPLEQSAAAFALADYLNFVAEPRLLLTVAVYGALMFTAARAAVGTRDRLFPAVLAWLVVMLVFYTFFNPAEAPLYAGQAVFPLAVLLARGLQASRLGWPGTALVAAFAGLVALQNLPVLHRTAAHVAANPKLCQW
jgi:hypothetical protein